MSFNAYRWGEGSMIMGVFSFSLYLILGLCSLPSVAQKLSWSEWTFIQSVLGYLGLAMAGVHTFLLLVNSLCIDRGLACTNFSPLNPELQLSKWPGRVPTRTYIQPELFLVGYFFLFFCLFIYLFRFVLFCFVLFCFVLFCFFCQSNMHWSNFLLRNISEKNKRE